MNLFQQLAAAALLVALTLCLQCAGVAVTVEWLKTVAIKERSKTSDRSLCRLGDANHHGHHFPARRDYSPLG